MIQLNSSLKDLSWLALTDLLKSLVKKEQAVDLEILFVMEEAFSRNQHPHEGVGTFFSFLTLECGMTASAAQRRIQALRLVSSVPEAKEQIQLGRLSLSNAAEIQTAVSLERKLGKTVSDSTVLALVEGAGSKSARQCKRELASALPAQAESRAASDRVRPLPKNRTQIVLGISSELEAKLEQVKSIFSHKNPSPSTEELLELMADFVLQKKLVGRGKAASSSDSKSSRTEEKEASIPVVLTAPAIPLPTSATLNTPTGRTQKCDSINKLTRFIPIPIKKLVLQRSGGRCEYIHPSTSKRCPSTRLLQIDHIQKFSEGGDHSPSNLRMLCQAHNLAREASWFL